MQEAEESKSELNFNHIIQNRDLFSYLEKAIPQTIGNLKRAEQTRAMLLQLQQRISKQQEIPSISNIITSIDNYTTLLLECLFTTKKVKEDIIQEEQIPIQKENNQQNNCQISTSIGYQIILKEDVNTFVLEDAMEKTRQCIFDIMMDYGQKGLNNNSENVKVMDEMIAYLLSASGKLSLLIELLPLVVYFKKDDLLSLPRYDNRWRRLYNTSLQYKKIASDAELINQLKVFEKSIYLANSLCYKVYNIENKPLKQIMGLVRSAQYFFFTEQARLLTVKFQTNPDPKAAVLVWDVIEQIKIWEIFVASVLDSIAYHEIIQVDASAYPTITEEMIDSELANKTIFNQYEIEPIIKKAPADTNIEIPSPNKIQLRLICAKKMQKRNYGKPLVLKQNNKTYTQSIFSGVKNIFKAATGLGMSTNQNSNQTDEFLEQDINQNNRQKELKIKGEKQVFDEVVFHIHGGGWISMSSFSHQIYTRRWANILKDVPIFSIDYKLLPESKYPIAIADCFQAYCWILFNAEDYYNIKINKILIAGDSAGANMALAVCLLAHKNGIRQPDGLLLCYPAVTLCTDYYTPSFLTSLFDPIIPHTFIKCCISQYVSEKRDPKKDPFLSPMLYPNEIMKKLPPIRIIIGEDDLLHDDTIRFTEKLLLAGATNVKTTVYNYMRHGFLNYDYPFGFNSSIAIVDGGNMLEELFNPCLNTSTY